MTLLELALPLKVVWPVIEATPPIWASAMSIPLIMPPFESASALPSVVAAVAELVIELTGSKSKIVTESLPPDDPKQRRPDITLAKEKLGWEPKIPLREGLMKSIPYFERVLRHARR